MIWTTNGGVTAQILTIYRPAAGDCISQYWCRLRNIKDGLQNLKYGILSDFMTHLTVLPHFSAAVVRIFSSMNCTKTRQTNSLKAETVKSRILAKQAITRGNNICTTWTPSKKLLSNLETGTISQRYLKRMKH